MPWPVQMAESYGQSSLQPTSQTVSRISQTQSSRSSVGSPSPVCPLLLLPDLLFIYSHTVNAGATDRLYNAATTANASYDETAAVTVFAAEARDENA